MSDVPEAEKPKEPIEYKRTRNPKLDLFVFGARPVIRWVGGKTSILDQLLQWVPSEISGTYYEPFIGAGALFWCLAGHGIIKKAVIADLNVSLITMYKEIKKDPDELLRRVLEYKNDKALYDAEVKIFNQERADGILDTAAHAARFYFLNRVGFNGLFRTRLDGGYNTPYAGFSGKKRNGDLNYVKVVADQDIFKRASAALQIADILCCDFEQTVSGAVPGDFCYFDPPYIPLKITSFVQYNSTDFTMKDQIRLRDLALRLKSKGIDVLLSNSSAGASRDLYSAFDTRVITAFRHVNSKVEDRDKPVKELLAR